MFNVQFPMSSCSKLNAVSILNASKSMPKLSTPDTLMSLLIDPLTTPPHTPQHTHMVRLQCTQKHTILERPMYKLYLYIGPPQVYFAFEWIVTL